ncbi:MAG: diguanylate cyclase [Burkholderiales bacterium]|nr:diguanylate cyclase [Burkholderiales bacterium]
MGSPRTSASSAWRFAQRAWDLLHADSAQSRELAERALAEAERRGDEAALGWARLASGFHLLYYGTAADAAEELGRAEAHFARCGDAAGRVLCQAGQARAICRQGDAPRALAHVLPLRDEGLRALRPDQRGVLLNTIAGCYSALGESAQAFAYMFEALRDAGSHTGGGFDVVLHCNLSHELLQIGDYEHALLHVSQGLARGQALKNPRLTSVLWINRVIALTELGRAAESLPDIAALLALPPDPSGRGRMAPHHETLAIAALRAGQPTMGRELVARAWALGDSVPPDERLERACATALLALADQRPADALQGLVPMMSEAANDLGAGGSVRVRAQYFGVLSEAQEAAGHVTDALQALRQQQRLQRLQSQLASRARYQAAALQSEVIRLQQRLDRHDAHRRRLEAAREELATANTELRHQVAQVKALQQALVEQATHDPLTGLFNRRHLNDALPTLFALAARDAQPMALAIIDLDHFKRINDEYGHIAGDQLLAAFGELLSGHCRRSDVACRYGGEEFCLLMPRTDAAGARRKVQSLLRRWRAQAFDLGGLRVDGLSFSAGVADTLLAAHSPDALLKAADDRLLAAKREGRNRVGVAA